MPQTALRGSAKFGSGEKLLRVLTFQMIQFLIACPQADLSSRIATYENNVGPTA
jgi:hypothetical protein